MATTEERMKILEMIKEGKITAEEGAKLLAALSQSQKGPRKFGNRTGGGSRWFRVRVTDTVTGKTKTSVNIPLRLMEWGVQIGAQFAPEVGNISMEQIYEMAQSGMEGKIIDVVDEEDGEHVEIFIE
ncbi:MAG TPA: hypothetical protein VFZ76_07970 [Anaerolineales bacterium]